MQQQQPMLFGGQQQQQNHQGPSSAMLPFGTSSQMSPGFNTGNGMPNGNQQPNPQLMLPPGLDRDKLQGMSQVRGRLLPVSTDNFLGNSDF
jgi:hypothetical protein